MQKVSRTLYRTLWIGRHAHHRHIYTLWLALISTVVLCLIYFYWLICTSFRPFRFQVKFLFWGLQFRRICYEVILRSISEAQVRISTIALILIIITVVWIERWFIMELILSLLIKIFSVWCDPLHWMNLDWEKCYLSVFITEWFKFKLPIFKEDIDSYFLSTMFCSLLNYAWWISIWTDYFPPCWKISKKVCIGWYSE